MKSNSELKLKGIKDEYSLHSIRKIGYYLQSIVDLRKDIENLKSLNEFYVERTVDPKPRKKGKKINEKVLQLLTRTLKIELEFRQKIIPQIKKEVCNDEEAIDEEKAKEIKEERKKIEREVNKVNRHIQDFLDSME